MAKASFNFPFNNNLGDMSIYKMRGIEKYILRMKGGATKKKIKLAPEFETLRLFNHEFGGCAKAGSKIFKILKPIKHLSDHHFFGGLQQICSLVQSLDVVNPIGQRSILFTQHADMLPGFNTNKSNIFDSILKHSPDCIFSRNDRSAMLYFPEMYPNINLKNPWNQQFFRIISVLGILPDMVYTIHGYMQANKAVQYNPVQEISPWMPVNEVFAATVVHLQLGAESFLDDSGKLIVTIGIEFGKAQSQGVIMPGKYLGSAKILAVG